jgi:hypothetical protein
MATKKEAKKKVSKPMPNTLFIERVEDGPDDYFDVIQDKDVVYLSDGKVVAKYELVGFVRVRQETHVESV